jgi:hypothetical protein
MGEPQHGRAGESCERDTWIKIKNGVGHVTVNLKMREDERVG